MIYKTADKGARIANFIIDLTAVMIAYSILVCLLVFLFPDVGMEYDFILFITAFLYYFLAETYFGKTIGKVITKTQVVDKYNCKASIWKIFIRTISRCFLPFDFFTFLFGFVGFHDLISGTRVVKNQITSHSN